MLEENQLAVVEELRGLFFLTISKKISHNPKQSILLQNIFEEEHNSFRD